MTSGKGGVGKAFVTTNPAVPLARQGHGYASAHREASAVGVPTLTATVDFVVKT